MFCNAGKKAPFFLGTVECTLHRTGFKYYLARRCTSKKYGEVEIQNLPVYLGLKHSTSSEATQPPIILFTRRVQLGIQKMTLLRGQSQSPFVKPIKTPAAAITSFQVALSLKDLKSYSKKIQSTDYCIWYPHDVTSLD